MTVEADIQELRKKIENAKSEKARREALAHHAAASLKTALADLKELGHDSPESALAEAKQIKENLSQTIEQIQKELELA